MYDMGKPAWSKKGGVEGLAEGEVEGGG